MYVVQMYKKKAYTRFKMWIFTTDGFFSAVQDKQDDKVIWIRARMRVDLERFVKHYDINATQIYENAGTDYAYRIAVWREEWARVMMACAEDVDYTNFKHAVGDRLGIDREIALIDIWGRMYDMQIEEQRLRSRLASTRPTVDTRKNLGNSDHGSSMVTSHNKQ